MQNWLFIAAGGAIGAAARWGVGYGLAGFILAFPLGTLLVNLAGSYALGRMYGRTKAEDRQSPLYIGLTAGFLGAFTTMSTFGMEVWLLAREGQLAMAAIYIIVSASAGPLLAAVGIRAGTPS